MNPSSYISKHTIYGMMSKSYKIIPNGFQKNKNKVNLFFPIDAETIKSKVEDNIYLTYLLEEEYNEFKSFGINHKKSKQKMVLSNINSEFLQLKGDKYHEFRETRNRYDKLCTIKTVPCSLIEINDLIDTWDELRGIKYGIQRHSGYDRNFFNKYWEAEKDNLFSYFFYIDEKLVGYSIVSKLGNGTNFNYIIRKNNTTYRNLCLYIDLKTFIMMYDEIQHDFIVNWGAASKNILKYKKKFPLHAELPVYFCKIIKEIL